MFFIAFREAGRRGGTEKSIDAKEKHPLVDSWRRLDWGLNLQRFGYEMTLSPTETHRPGHKEQDPGERGSEWRNNWSSSCFLK